MNHFLERHEWCGVELGYDEEEAGRVDEGSDVKRSAGASTQLSPSLNDVFPTPILVGTPNFLDVP